MNTVAETPSRVNELNAASKAAHERLEMRILAADPFQDREQYARFLRMQHAFHRDIDALYEDPGVAEVLPDLAGRRRLPAIKLDLADLGACVPNSEADPLFARATDLATALGWLYVAEGSNLGAASLLKRGSKLGLSATFGARHLAPAPEGRGLQWRTFSAAIDAAKLSSDGNDRLIDAAAAAFAHVQSLAEAMFPISGNASEADAPAIT